ncbi:hypothetical protein LEP1GSC073_1065 [Leptospira noguchii str. Cascata]|nr:hypothetical protein LEP1GSC073_1065 [Leptospira noguchii str. Cascata]
MKLSGASLWIDIREILSVSYSPNFFTLVISNCKIQIRNSSHKLSHITNI